MKTKHFKTSKLLNGSIMLSLLEYNHNYSETSGSLWNFYRDKIDDDDDDDDNDDDVNDSVSDDK